MKIFLCILISEKNQKFLQLLLKSLNSLKKNLNYELNIIFITQKKNIYFDKFIKKKLLNNIKYKILKSSRNSIPYSRNLYLNYIRKKNFQYGGFLDDDCIIDSRWLINMIKFINKNKCDIVGGPQKHILKNKKYKKFYDLIEPNRKNGEIVDWIATNNSFFKSKVIKSNKIKFDEKLTNYGGSDQLFFKLLSKKNYLIRWNSNSKVFENYQENREKNKWFFNRNLRYGYSGNIIDLRVYGRFKGTFVIFSKIIFLIIQSLIFICFPLKYNYLKSYFFLIRAAGRLIGIFNYNPKKYI
tara:strand:- start:1365 stop:2255 length:891 start_codon:yes stop_codon:yes gene_type:complete